MISVPLPIVVAVVLGFLLCLLVMRRDRRFRSIIVFLAASIVLMIVVSLRWSFETPVFRFLQPVVAAHIPPSAWLCFSGLQGGPRRQVWPHILPALAMMVLSFLWPRFQSPIDMLLAGLFFGYGGALIWRRLGGEENFAATRLGVTIPASGAAVFVGVLLLLAGAIDLAIAFDFGLRGGAHIGLIVSAGSMIMLPLIAWAALSVAHSLPVSEDLPAEERVDEPVLQDRPDSDDEKVLAATERVLREGRLYRDPNLTLERLARRVGIPGRQISQAINRQRGRNVSQEINRWRIREAMELLEQTDRTVTAIMFDCGFQTKSNFNSSFRRETGLSPNDWRRWAQDNAGRDFSEPRAPGQETR